MRCYTRLCAPLCSSCCGECCAQVPRACYVLRYGARHAAHGPRCLDWLRAAPCGRMPSVLPPACGTAAGTASAQPLACTTSTLSARNLGCLATLRSQVGVAQQTRVVPASASPRPSSPATAPHAALTCVRPCRLPAAPLLMSSVQFAFQSVIARSVLGLGLLQRTGAPINWQDWARNGEATPPRPCPAAERLEAT